MDEPSVPHALYKRHVLHFLNHRCRAMHLDLPKLEQERVVRVSGAYPNQLLVLVVRRRRRRRRRRLWCRIGRVDTTTATPRMWPLTLR